MKKAVSKIPKPTAKLVMSELKKLASPAKAKELAGYFKTGKGGYGEGDIFLGISVPTQRMVAVKHADLPLTEILKLLKSGIHEHRFTAFEILTFEYDRADAKRREAIVDFYLKHARLANNWDLVDTSAPYILGVSLVGKDTTILDVLAKSDDLWERRIAIVATLGLIRVGDTKHTYRICKTLMRDIHDLIHKACGWMLRESGKRDEAGLKAFLDNHAAHMPRTMLRYSLERFSPEVRAKYMSMGKKIVKK
jgi:3-methyladenine DNA glycosylase AlkD